MFQIGLTFVFVLVTWVIWCVFQVLLRPLDGLVKRYPYSQGAFWFLLWVAQVAVFIVVGASEGESPGF